MSISDRCPNSNQEQTPAISPLFDDQTEINVYISLENPLSSEKKLSDRVSTGCGKTDSVPCLVSGHEFTHAENATKTVGLQPLFLHYLRNLSFSAASQPPPDRVPLSFPTDRWTEVSSSAQTSRPNSVGYPSISLIPLRKIFFRTLQVISAFSLHLTQCQTSAETVRKVSPESGSRTRELYHILEQNCTINHAKRG